jgi:hypothetical protein
MQGRSGCGYAGGRTTGGAGICACGAGEGTAAGDASTRERAIGLTPTATMIPEGAAMIKVSHLRYGARHPLRAAKEAVRSAIRMSGSALSFSPISKRCWIGLPKGHIPRHLQRASWRHKKIKRL